MSSREILIVGFSVKELHDPQLIERVGLELLGAVAQANDKRLAVDFTGVLSMSPAMITKLVMLNKECKAKSVHLKLYNPAPNIMEIFETTKLNKLFNIVYHLDDDPDDPDPVACRLYDPARASTRFITKRRVVGEFGILENEG